MSNHDQLPPRTMTNSRLRLNSDHHRLHCLLLGLTCFLASQAFAQIYTDPITFEEFAIGDVNQPLIVDGVSFQVHDTKNSTMLIGPDPDSFLSVGGLDESQALEYQMFVSWAPGFDISIDRAVQSVGMHINPAQPQSQLRVRAYSPNQGDLVYDAMHPVPGSIVIEADELSDSLRVGDDQGGFFSIDNFFTSVALCYVNHAAAGANDGSSWEDAYVELQDALADLACDEIWVAAGNYVPNGASIETSSFELRDDLKIFGGFEGIETERNQRDWTLNETVLVRAEQTCNIVHASGVNSVTLDGFIVSDGFSGDDCPAGRDVGAGLLLVDSSANLANLIIRGSFCNPTLNSGGCALFALNSSIVLSRSSVQGNQGGMGLFGGIGVDGGTISVSDVKLRSNGGIGAAPMGIVNATSHLESVAFHNNSSDYGAGGLSINGGVHELVNVTFSSNSVWSSIDGPGALALSSANVTLINNTFAGNTTAQGNQDETIVLQSGTIKMINTLIAGSCISMAGAVVDTESSNNLVDNPDNTCGLVDGENGNQTGLDPLLGPLADNGGSSLTHALLLGSPAITAGSNLHCPETDQRGIARPQGSTCDVGAYEFVDVFFQDRFEVAPLQPGNTFKDCPDCPTMVMIPAGSFTQGAPESEPQSQPQERPQRTVNVPAFAMGQTAVTFDQWDACVADGGCTPKPDDYGWGRGNRPVIDVSWNDAQQYVTWLSNKTGQDYRLPSESEWEYATRAGTTGRFNTGDCITTDQANFRGTNQATGCPSGIVRNQTLPVASFAPNAFGLYDTHGNTLELVQDCWNENYVGAPTDGSAWMSGDCSLAVKRGGSWDNEGTWLRSAYRGITVLGPGNPGFRVARSLPPSTVFNQMSEWQSGLSSIAVEDFEGTEFEEIHSSSPGNSRVQEFSANGIQYELFNRETNPDQCPTPFYMTVIGEWEDNDASYHTSRYLYWQRNCTVDPVPWMRISFSSPVRHFAMKYGRFFAGFTNMEIWVNGETFAQSENQDDYVFFGISSPNEFSEIEISIMPNGAINEFYYAP